MASSDIISGDHGGSKTIFGWTAETPGRSPTNSFICSETWGPIGQAGRRQGEGDVDLLILDVDVVDEAERDEVEAQLGVDYLLEGLEDVVLGDSFCLVGVAVWLSDIAQWYPGASGSSGGSSASGAEIELPPADVVPGPGLPPDPAVDADRTNPRLSWSATLASFGSVIPAQAILNRWSRRRSNSTSYRARPSPCPLLAAAR